MMRPSGGGEGGEFDPADREAMQAAREACSQYLEGIAQQFQRTDMTEMQDLMLEYAACMRENGVDMEDPDFTDTTRRAARAPGARLGFDIGRLRPGRPHLPGGQRGLPGDLRGRRHARHDDGRRPRRRGHPAGRRHPRPTEAPLPSRRLTRARPDTARARPVTGSLSKTDRTRPTERRPMQEGTEHGERHACRRRREPHSGSRQGMGDHRHRDGPPHRRRGGLVAARAPRGRGGRRPPTTDLPGRGGPHRHRGASRPSTGPWASTKGSPSARACRAPSP